MAQHPSLLLVALLCATAVTTAEAQSPSPLSKADMKAFLEHAPVVRSERLQKGITRPWRLTLRDERLTHDAEFQSIDERKAERYVDKSKRGELDFVDSYRYNIAAYAVAELIGLDEMMPISVERHWQGTPGSITWWVDDVMMDEGERRKTGATPPDRDAWNKQMDMMDVFTALVYDTDRNPENVLIGAGWKVWIIDFTRAFRTWPELESPKLLNRCDRSLLDRLRSLKKSDVEARTKSQLVAAEVRGLMARRDKLVAHFDSLIAERGAARVLFDYYPHP